MADDMAYIGVCKCGKLVAAIVDCVEHKKEVSREIAKWVRWGLIVNRRTVESVREMDFCRNHGKCE